MSQLIQRDNTRGRNSLAVRNCVGRFERSDSMRSLGRGYRETLKLPIRDLSPAVHDSIAVWML